MDPTNEPLSSFSPPARAWFEAAFERPTRVQAEAWPVIASGQHSLLVAPTGSGKTLAAFLWCIDQIAAEKTAATPACSAVPLPARGLAARRKKDPPATAGVSCLYISPLKALSHDIERNLRAPLVGIGNAAERLDLARPEVTVAVRTGDTAPEDRRAIVRHPPDILITTPESLYLMLTSQSVRRQRVSRDRGQRDRLAS